jgi:hypothetical protein
VSFWATQVVLLKIKVRNEAFKYYSIDDHGSMNLRTTEQRLMQGCPFGQNLQQKNPQEISCRFFYLFRISIIPFLPLPELLLPLPEFQLQVLLRQGFQQPLLPQLWEVQQLLLLQQELQLQELLLFLLLVLLRL